MYTSCVYMYTSCVCRCTPRTHSDHFSNLTHHINYNRHPLPKLSRVSASAAPRLSELSLVPRLLCVGGEPGNKANQYQDDNQTGLPVSTTSIIISVYHYHPQHCYTINTSTTDVSVYCSGHHPDCEMEDHQKTSQYSTWTQRFCRAGCICWTQMRPTEQVMTSCMRCMMRWYKTFKTRAAGSKLARGEAYWEQEWGRSNCSVCSRAYLWVRACWSICVGV